MGYFITVTSRILRSCYKLSICNKTLAKYFITVPESYRVTAFFRYGNNVCDILRYVFFYKYVLSVNFFFADQYNSSQHFCRSVLYKHNFVAKS